MNATIYGKYLRLVRNWVDNHLGGSSPHLHMCHDRWGSHIGKPAQAILSALNFSSTSIRPTSHVQLVDVAIVRPMRTRVTVMQAAILWRRYQENDDKFGTKEARKIIIQCCCQAWWGDAEFWKALVVKVGRQISTQWFTNSDPQSLCSSLGKPNSEKS